MKIFYKVLAILLGYGLIIAGFIIFGTSLSDEVLILDTVVSCLMYTQLVEFFIFPMINTNEEAHKEVGMMGIHYTALRIYFFVALVFMIVGIALDLPFTWQLLMQLFALLILVIGRITTLHAGDKVSRVYEREQQVISDKTALQNAVKDITDAVFTAQNLDSAIASRLNELEDAARYVSPSSNPEAISLNKQFISLSSELCVLLHNTNMNKQRIEETTALLEQTLRKRKRY